MLDVLERDHEAIDGFLGELFRALDQDEQGESFARLDLLWARLAMHIRAEHLCLFPAILDASQIALSGGHGTPQLGDVQSAIGVLRDDHDFFMHALAKAVNLMRALNDITVKGAVEETLSEVRSIVLSVSRRLKAHNQLEENQVYKWVDLLLDEAGRSALGACVRREVGHLPARFVPGGETSAS